MKYICIIIILVLLSSCANTYDLQRKELSQDIEVLKLKVRKEKLENLLEQLENE